MQAYLQHEEYRQHEGNNFQKNLARILPFILPKRGSDGFCKNQSTCHTVVAFWPEVSPGTNQSPVLRTDVDALGADGFFPAYQPGQTISQFLKHANLAESCKHTFASERYDARVSECRGSTILTSPAQLNI